MCAEKLKIKRVHIILRDYVGSKIKWLKKGKKREKKSWQANPANKISMKKPSKNK